MNLFNLHLGVIPSWTAYLLPFFLTIVLRASSSPLQGGYMSAQPGLTNFLCYVEAPVFIIFKKELGPLSFFIRPSKSCQIASTYLWYDKAKLGLKEKLLNDSSVHITLDLSCEPGVHMLTFYGDKDSDETVVEKIRIKVVNPEQIPVSYVVYPPTPLYYLDAATSLLNPSLCFAKNQTVKFRVTVKNPNPYVHPKAIVERVETFTHRKHHHRLHADDVRPHHAARTDVQAAGWQLRTDERPKGLHVKGSETTTLDVIWQRAHPLFLPSRYRLAFKIVDEYNVHHPNHQNLHHITFQVKKSCHDPPTPPPKPLHDESSRDVVEDAVSPEAGSAIDGNALNSNASIPQIVQGQERSLWVNLVILICLIQLILL